jgi:hypothetical protein
MLIEKIETNQVYCFKLVNGDEVIGRLLSYTDQHYEVSRPVTVLPSGQGIGLIQSLFSMRPDSEVKISRDHVMIFCDIDPRMRDHYIQTTTGIQPVSSDKMIIT